MFWRFTHFNSLNGGTSGWADRARRKDRERAAAELMAELQWQWRSACQGTSLAQMIYTPSGPTKAIPLIGHIDVGPPIAINVKMRPGQTIRDFVAAAPLIAPVLDVAALEVTPLAPHPQWVRIVLRSADSAHGLTAV